MERSYSLRKTLLITVMAALCVSAIVGIFTFLFGSFDETGFKILATTLAIGGFSLTGLCCSVLLEKGRQKALAISGIGISMAAFLYSILIIWGTFDLFGDNTWKFFAILLVLAFSSAHSSLMLLIDSNRPLVRNSLISTIIFISIVALLITILVLNEDDLGEFFTRLIGVFAILDVLGTIVTPVLNKVSLSEDKNVTPVS